MLLQSEDTWPRRVARVFRPPLLIACALAAGGVLATSPSTCWLVLLAAAALLLAYLLIARAPEVALTLFLFAGQFKAAPVFAQLSQVLDLTLLFALLFLAAGARTIAITARLKGLDRRLASVWILLCCLLVASLLWTPSVGYGFSKALQFVTLSSLAFFGPSIVASAGKPHINRLLLSLLLFSTVYSAETLPAALAAGSSFDFVSFPGSNYLGLGRIASVGTIILLAYVLPRGRVAAMLAIIPLAITGGALLFSGGRAPLLAVGLALIVLACALPIMRSKRGLVVAMYIPAIVGVLAVLAHFDLLPATTTYRLSLLAPDVIEQDPSSSAHTRVELWDSALEGLASRPLYGLGSGGFARWYSGKDVREHPHDVFLETGSELGLPGVVLVCLLLWIPLRTWVKAAKTAVSDQAVFLLLCVLGLLVIGWANAAVSGDLNDNRLAWMASGLVVAVCRQTRLPIRKKE